MKWIGFTFFVIITLCYIWNGSDFYTKKEWRAFFMKFVAVLVCSFLLVFILVGISKFLPLITKESARSLTVIIPASFMAVLLSKFFVIMLSTIFSIIMRFHVNYNSSENNSKLSLLGQKYGEKLLVLAKGLASFGCVLMFYGIWFGSTK